MDKTIIVNFIKKNFLTFIMLLGLSLAVSYWLVLLLDPYDEEGFIIAVSFFTLLGTAAFKWQLQGGILRSFIVPLKISSFVTLISIVFRELNLLSFDRDYVFVQFVCLYITILLAYASFKDQFDGPIKGFISKITGNKSLSIVWLTIALMTVIMMVNSKSISAAGERAFDRAEAAYEKAADAYDHAGDAYKKAREAYNHAEEAHDLITTYH